MSATSAASTSREMYALVSSNVNGPRTIRVPARARITSKQGLTSSLFRPEHPESITIKPNSSFACNSMRRRTVSNTHQASSCVSSKQMIVRRSLWLWSDKKIVNAFSRSARPMSFGSRPTACTTLRIPSSASAQGSVIRAMVTSLSIASTKQSIR